MARCEAEQLLNIRVWSNIDVFWDMRWSLARQVRQALNDAQCSLPLRTRELHIVQSTANGPQASATQWSLIV